MRKNNAINAVHAPSLLQSEFDLSHDGVEERFHFASHRSRSVSNGNKRCRLVSKPDKVIMQGRRTKRALVWFLELCE